MDNELPFWPIFIILGLLLIGIIGGWVLHTCPTCEKYICSNDGDVVDIIEEFCYDFHNPNSTSDYRESWGRAYRQCLIYNLHIKGD